MLDELDEAGEGGEWTLPREVVPVEATVLHPDQFPREHVDVEIGAHGDDGVQVRVCRSGILRSGQRLGPLPPQAGQAVELELCLGKPLVEIGNIPKLLPDLPGFLLALFNLPCLVEVRIRPSASTDEEDEDAKHDAVADNVGHDFFPFALPFAFFPFSWASGLGAGKRLATSPRRTVTESCHAAVGDPRYG